MVRGRLLTAIVSFSDELHWIVMTQDVHPSKLGEEPNL